MIFTVFDVLLTAYRSYHLYKLQFFYIDFLLTTACPFTDLPSNQPITSESNGIGIVRFEIKSNLEASQVPTTKLTPGSGSWLNKPSKIASLQILKIVASPATYKMEKP